MNTQIVETLEKAGQWNFRTKVSIQLMFSSRLVRPAVIELAGVRCAGNIMMFFDIQVARSIEVQM